MTEFPTIVTVIEGGPLEHQIKLLVESLRRWGGSLANAPVIAVQPRRGPALSKSTSIALNVSTSNIAAFIATTNSPGTLGSTRPPLFAMLRESHPGTIVWLDPDVIVLDDIPELWLDPENPNSAQFAACAPEQGIGTARDDDEHAPYFRAVCETLRVDFQSIPYIVTERDRVRIRAYWNAGIYAFVGASGFARAPARIHPFVCSPVGVVSHRSWQFFQRADGADARRASAQAALQSAALELQFLRPAGRRPPSTRRSRQDHQNSPLSRLSVARLFRRTRRWTWRPLSGSRRLAA